MSRWNITKTDISKSAFLHFLWQLFVFVVVVFRFFKENLSHINTCCCQRTRGIWTFALSPVNMADQYCAYLLVFQNNYSVILVWYGLFISYFWNIKTTNLFASICDIWTFYYVSYKVSAFVEWNIFENIRLLSYSPYWNEESIHIYGFNSPSNHCQ